MGVSLVSAPVIGAVAGTWLLAVVLVVRSARRSTVLLVPRTAVWSALGVAGTALGLHASGVIPLDIPRWFYLLAVAPFVGPAAAVAGWRALRPRLRVAAVATLPLGLVAAGLVYNQHYRYWPTTGSLLGHDHVDPRLAAPVALALAGGAVAPEASRALTPDQRGRIVDVAIPGTTSGFAARTARLWLPPDFLADPTRPRTAVELIGGTPGWPSDWTRAAGLDGAADRMAATSADAPILVMVDANGSAFGDTECVGASERYLTVDVPDFLAAHFHVPATSAAWGVAGYSEGGTCAVVLALRHPDRFRAFADLAGDAHPDVGGHHRTVQQLFGGSEVEFAAHDPTALLAAGRYPQLSGWFAWGRADGAPRRATRSLAEGARSAGMEVVEAPCSGGHDFGFVADAVSQALPWLSDRLDAGTT